MSRTVINWTPEMDSLLGQDEDSVIASRLFNEFSSMRWITSKLVQERRKALGIEGHGRNRSKPTSGKPRQPTTVTPPWTPEEDEILETALAKVSARINRPTSQIQKRMKQIGVPNFGSRVKPRSPAKVAEEEAIKERNKARFDRKMRAGMAVAALVAERRTLTAAAQELGFSGVEYARQQLLKFLRVAGHSTRLGNIILLTPWREIPPHLLTEAIRRMSVEIETGSLDVWHEPVPVNVEQESESCP